MKNKNKNASTRSLSLYRSASASDSYGFGSYRTRRSITRQTWRLQLNLKVFRNFWELCSSDKMEIQRRELRRCFLSITRTQEVGNIQGWLGQILRIPQLIPSNSRKVKTSPSRPLQTSSRDHEHERAQICWYYILLQLYSRLLNYQIRFGRILDLSYYRYLHSMIRQWKARQSAWIF